MTSEEIINKIKEKAVEFAKTHAANNTKAFYVLGKQEAASTFLAMIKNDGMVAAIKDVAKELVKHDPSNPHAKWILENNEWEKL